MIPGKQNTAEAQNAEVKNENTGGFSFFDPAHFMRRVIKNWFWFVLMGVLGYALSYVYSRYYAQRIYASTLSLSISSNTASYFTPNQSINFIWGQGGNQDGVFLKKMLLSRSHNEYLVKELGLHTNYSTKGLIKATYLDKGDSPVLLEIDTNHPQQVNYPITLIPKGRDSYQVQLPEEGHSTKLYRYTTEDFVSVPAFTPVKNKTISVGQWYSAPNLRFRLVKNPFFPGELKLDNVIVTLSTVNDAVNQIVSTIDVNFDKELNTVMNITKKGYNLNGTVNFLNTSVAKLIEKRTVDQGMVDKNTEKYIKENLEKVRKRLDSAGVILNSIKVSEKLYDIENKDVRTLELISELDAKKADVITKINSLKSVNQNVASGNLDKLIGGEATGVKDGAFDASVADLKTLYARRRELATIYTPNSEPMREINRLINEARTKSQNGLKNYYNGYYSEIESINRKISQAEGSLTSFPEKQRRYLDAERGYKMIEATYNTLLTKQGDLQMRIVGNKTDLTIIDPAKNLNQAPIAPNIKQTQYLIMGGLLLLPLLFLIIGEVLDNKIRNIKELLHATKIPLLGVIGRNNHDNGILVA